MVCSVTNSETGILSKQDASTCERNEMLCFKPGIGIFFQTVTQCPLAKVRLLLVELEFSFSESGSAMH